MDSPIEILPGEGLLMHRAVGVAIEEAAELVLQFIDAFDRTVDELPGEFLIVEPLAALDRVHEVALDRIALGDGDVVAALDHPGRSEEHTSELQSLMRISYAVFCLKKKKKHDII